MRVTRSRRRMSAEPKAVPLPPFRSPSRGETERRSRARATFILSSTLASSNRCLPHGPEITGGSGVELELSLDGHRAELGSRATGGRVSPRANGKNFSKTIPNYHPSSGPPRQRPLTSLQFEVSIAHRQVPPSQLPELCEVGSPRIQKVRKSDGPALRSGKKTTAVKTIYELAGRLLCNSLPQHRSRENRQARFE